jgi:hypothetical protein
MFLWFRLRRSRTRHTLPTKQQKWIPHSNTNSLPISWCTFPITRLQAPNGLSPLHVETRVQRLLHTSPTNAPNTMPAPYLGPQPPRDTRNLLHDLELALRSAQLTRRQRQDLLAHLALSDMPPNATSSHAALPNQMRSKRSARQGHFLMLGDILGMVTSAQLTPTDRRALVTFLGQSPDLNPTRLPDVASEERDPPPYAP